jgi:hypothetical protein
MNTPYEIVVFGHLPPEWSSVFGQLKVVCQPDGNTVITGVLPDQAALYGLLMSLRDWGISLISVNLVAQIGIEHHEKPA